MRNQKQAGGPPKSGKKTTNSARSNSLNANMPLQISRTAKHSNYNSSKSIGSHQHNSVSRQKTSNNSATNLNHNSNSKVQVPGLPHGSHQSAANQGSNLQMSSERSGGSLLKKFESLEQSAKVTSSGSRSKLRNHPPRHIQ